MNLLPHIEKFRRRFAEIESLLSDPKVFDNPQNAQELSREYARLKELVAAGDGFIKTLAQLEENRALLKSEPAESEFAVLAKEEILRLEAEEKKLAQQIQFGLVPPDPTDSRNTIIEIRAGAGGSESALFAADLYRMYCRYAETRGWKVEPLDSNPSDLGGFKEIIFEVTGTDVFKRLKYESGVHRVQRVPATEAQGRIHTSTTTVAVMPEAQEVDVEIKPDEIEINVCRASGKGGQGVNTTDSAVQIIHKPTGMIVRCADQRSQQKNKLQALNVLRSRLLDRKIAEEDAKYAAHRKDQVGTGERSEKNRTYNFPQNRVTDHRVEITLYNLANVIDGDLDGLIDPLMSHDMEGKTGKGAGVRADMNSEVRRQEPEAKPLAPAKSFEQLIVWQKAHQFVLGIYRFTESFPRHEIYGLTSQLRRAAVSIPANIAEGFKKRGRADKARFLNIAQASLEECRYYLILAKDLNYGDTTQHQPKLEEVSKLLEAYTAKILTSGS